MGGRTLEVPAGLPSVRSHRVHRKRAESTRTQAAAHESAPTRNSGTGSTEVGTAECPCTPEKHGDVVESKVPETALTLRDSVIRIVYPTAPIVTRSRRR